MNNSKISGYGHFDNYKFGMQSDIGFFQGILAAFQFINHKTDSGFDFGINEFPRNKNSLTDCLKDIYKTDHEIKYSTIDHSKVNKILTSWLFSFLPDYNELPVRSHLLDRNNDFSLSNKDDIISFTNDYILHLLEVVKPLNIYILKGISTSFYLGNDYDIICFENKHKIYLMSLSWSD